jgi:hypothetical protein
MNQTVLTVDLCRTPLPLWLRRLWHDRDENDPIANGTFDQRLWDRALSDDDREANTERLLRVRRAA